MINGFVFALLACAVVHIEGAAINKGQYEVPLTKRGTSKADLQQLGEQLNSKYAKSAQNYLTNTGGQHHLFDYSTVDKILAATGKIHNATQDKLGKRDEVETSLTDHQTYFTGEVAIGTPGQIFPVDFDTGSADLWVVGSAESHAGQFNVASSKSAQSQNRKFSIAYADGSTYTGGLYSETLTYGSLSVPNQTIAVIPASQSTDSISSLAGLAWPSISKTGDLTLVQNMFSQGLISQSLFAFDMSDAPSLTLGNYDPKRADLVWKNVTDQSFWMVDDVSLGHDLVPIVKSQPAALDTGTTGIAMSKMQLMQLFWGIPYTFPLVVGGTLVYAYPCGTNLPAFDVGISGTLFKFAPAEYTETLTDSLCYATFMGLDSPQKMLVIGDTFFRKVYSVFDYDGSQVGLGVYK